MKVNEGYEELTGELSRDARSRMSRPLFHADWLDVVFLHYEMEPEVLRGVAPFEPDLREGKAYVSLVAFTLRGMRSDMFARAGAWLLRGASNHDFLNARTYVRCGSATGIYFLAEWLSKKTAVPLGRPLFGLPYYFGRFERRCEGGEVSGEICGKGGRLSYRGEFDEEDQAGPCAKGSLDEFLLERYVAFTQWGGLRRFFRVWHEPWAVAGMDARVVDASLLEQTGEWASEARLVCAHYSPGVRDVWMGRPELVGANT